MFLNMYVILRRHVVSRDKNYPTYISYCDEDIVCDDLQTDYVGECIYPLQNTKLKKRLLECGVKVYNKLKEELPPDYYEIIFVDWNEIKVATINNKQVEEGIVVSGVNIPRWFFPDLFVKLLCTAVHKREVCCIEQNWYKNSFEPVAVQEAFNNWANMPIPNDHEWLFSRRFMQV